MALLQTPTDEGSQELYIVDLIKDTQSLLVKLRGCDSFTNGDLGEPYEFFNLSWKDDALIYSVYDSCGEKIYGSRKLIGTRKAHIVQ